MIDGNTGDAADSGRIAQFLQFISEKRSISDFLSEFNSLFPYIHEIELTESYRLARKPMKKVRDETAVLAHFLREHNHYEFVRQHLGNDIPDAWLWTKDTCIDVEITVALAEMRLTINERLNKIGNSPSFLIVTEVDDLAACRAAANTDSLGYSTEQYIDILYYGLIKRIRKKANTIRRGILLIDCPIGNKYASIDMIDQLVDKIVPDLPASGFERVYLVDRDRVAPLVRRS